MKMLLVSETKSFFLNFDIFYVCPRPSLSYLFNGNLNQFRSTSARTVPYWLPHCSFAFVCLCLRHNSVYITNSCKCIQVVHTEAKGNGASQDPTKQIY